ncbi:hypothetical protein JCM17380_16230 [Desulfosporosinus burensis]
MSLIVCRLIGYRDSIIRITLMSMSMLTDGSDFMSKNIRILFGNRVRKLRQALAISQEELAFNSDLHRTYISDIERGTRNISLDNIYKLAIALEVHPKDLFDF